jgi:hypothetical protein
MNIQPPEPLKAVFISKVFPENDDQKQDIRIRDKIAAQLKPLQMKGYISFWSEDLKMAAENIPELIREKYGTADIFILLGSDSVFDEDIFSKTKMAIELVQKDRSRKIVPVYVRHFLYESIEGIDQQSWIPRADYNKPVPVIDDEGNEDKKCTEVCEAIRKLITEVLSKQGDG